MREILSFCLCTIVAVSKLEGQPVFFIQPGAAVTVSGNETITLQNMNFVNNGAFSAGNGTLNITGNTLSTISGSSAINLYNLLIGNSGGVNLETNIGISNQFTLNGMLNVKNFSVNMGPSGIIVNENESNRLTDDVGNTGNASTTRNFVAALTNENPANLGVEFVSAPALGNTTITRICAAFIQNGSSVGLIRRYYNIQPANNSNLNATVRFYYLDAELNGVTENTAVLWKSDNNGASWSQITPDARNTALNYLEKNSVNDFSLWTIGSANSALPVILSAFNTTCKNNGANLVWTTQLEQNSEAFIIEKSVDAVNWSPIGTVSAKGAASTYQFTDAEAGTAYYRLKQTDKDGRFTYSNTLRSTCNIKSITLMLYPNPAIDYTELVFNSEKTRNTAIIQVYNGAGQLVQNIRTNIQKGFNKIKINMAGLSRGNYIVRLEDGDWKITKSFVKQ